MKEQDLRVLVIGGGAREHALAWKLGQSPRVAELFVAPGNAGTARIARNLAVSADDTGGLARTAQEQNIDLVVVGPEAPLAAGIVDRFRARGIPIFGPTAAASQIEASKVFAKDLMHRYGIPSAQSKSFASYAEAQDYVRSHPLPMVVKADGLAAGKGVTVARSREEALAALEDLMVRRIHGAAGERVIIEECLNGPEVSLLAFTDGETVLPMVPACDYKPIHDGDEGPNTGGMGCYSPPSFFGNDMVQQAMETILKPAVRAMAQEGCPYQGILFGGLIVADEGPKALEFNCRFGDPETQVILPRLKRDLVEVIIAVIERRLADIELEWDDGACVGVVMASGGYPGEYATGYPIEGLDALDEDVVVFHAGTRIDDDRVVTAGGRILTVVAQGRTMAEARAKAYRNVPRLRFEGSHYRTDIAAREV